MPSDCTLHSGNERNIEHDDIVVIHILFTYSSAVLFQYYNGACDIVVFWSHSVVRGLFAFLTWNFRNLVQLKQTLKTELW